MTTPTYSSYAGYRFPTEIISHAVWLYFRFFLSLRYVNATLAVRGVIVRYDDIRASVHHSFSASVELDAMMLRHRYLMM
jgi:transposase-like protein